MLTPSAVFAKWVLWLSIAHLPAPAALALSAGSPGLPRSCHAPSRAPYLDHVGTSGERGRARAPLGSRRPRWTCARSSEADLLGLPTIRLFNQQLRADDDGRERLVGR